MDSKTPEHEYKLLFNYEIKEPCPCFAGGIGSSEVWKGNTMNNKMTVSGKLKNIREFDQYGLMMVAQLTQKVGNERAKFTIPVACFDERIAPALRGLREMQDELGFTPVVNITGELDTKFDTRPNVQNDQRNQPLTRILITSVELAEV